MARCDECKANKVCDHNRFGFENCGNFIPYDVAPKSEVDLYKRQVDELEDELATTYDKLENANRDVEVMGSELSRYTENLMQMREQDKRNIAREIFEEIERLLDLNSFQGDIFTGKYFDVELATDIAELKKKYTEDQNNEN